jgi:spore maturation protein CgeB
MRILHFGHAGWDDSIYSLLAGFRKLGHEVLTCNMVNVWNTAGAAENAINAFAPNLVITVGVWHYYFDMQALSGVLKRHSIPHIYWAIDDPNFFDCISSIFMDKYDFVITPAKECVPKYIARGTPAIFLPFGCNPDFNKRVEPSETYKSDIVVVSNYIVPNSFSVAYPQRYEFRKKCFMDLIDPLVKRNYNLKIYGIGWEDPVLGIPSKFLGGSIDHSLVPSVYSSAKIALTIQWDYDGHICHKTFEVLGNRCMQIAPYTPVQAEFFTHGVHLIYSHSPEETVGYVHYYLAHDAERELIAASGQDEVYRNHSCTQRAKNAMEALKLHGFPIDYIQK